MIHSDTVLVMNRDGSWMSVGFTVSYVTGQVGCSRDYEAIFGSKCQGYQANMELHHISSSRSHDGICFVENPINNIIQKIVDRTPPPNVDSRYPAFSMEESFSNLWKVKHYEDQVALEQVDNVMECDPRDGPGPSSSIKMLFSKNTVIREAVTIGAFYMAGALLSDSVARSSRGSGQTSIGPWSVVIWNIKKASPGAWSPSATAPST
jgi:hypothetical protein